jgi:hypothetical protein
MCHKMGFVTKKDCVLKYVIVGNCGNNKKVWVRIWLSKLNKYRFGERCILEHNLYHVLKCVVHKTYVTINTLTPHLGWQVIFCAAVNFDIIIVFK